MAKRSEIIGCPECSKKDGKGNYNFHASIIKVRRGFSLSVRCTKGHDRAIIRLASIEVSRFGPDFIIR